MKWNIESFVKLLSLAFIMLSAYAILGWLNYPKPGFMYYIRQVSPIFAITVIGSFLIISYKNFRENERI